MESLLKRQFRPEFLNRLDEIVFYKPLTKEEINAENHFYSVPVDSEGLVGYWKLNDGAGQIIKDHSPSGNNMLGEINVHSSGGQQIGDPGMNWVEMSLP